MADNNEVPVPQGAIVGEVAVPQGATIGSQTSLSNYQPDTISARPGGIGSWLQDFESDIRYGGDRTVLGKALSAMGAKGLNVGSQAAAGDYMGSPILGPTHMAQGATIIPSHPLEAGKQMISGALETAQIPGSFIAPEAAEGASALPSAAGKAFSSLIPSTARAGEKLNQVMSVAKDIPLDLPTIRNSLTEITKLAARGGDMPTSAGKLAKRIAFNPEGEVVKDIPANLTYEEARDFYHNIGDDIASSLDAKKKTMARALSILKNNLGQEIQNATAKQITNPELPETYRSAMAEYHHASQLRDFLNDALQYSVRYLPWAAGAYLAKNYILPR